MRLICPNCGAQYDVPDDVVPAGGRDVQCSNCGHTWFETPGASEAAEAEDTAMFADDLSVTDTVQAASAAVEPPAPVEPEFDGSIDDAFADIRPDDLQPELPDTVSHFESAEGETQPTTAPTRRPVDPSIVSILQQEAAHEAAARRNEMGAALESQSDFALDELPIAPARPTRPVAETATEATVAATVSTATSRRELLPDIEEINSSLRSNAERGDESLTPAPEMTVEKRRGFRTGFFTVILLIGLGALAYVYAPQIAEQVPAAADPLATYVATVDQGRIWLDIKAQELLAMIRPTETQLDP